MMVVSVSGFLIGGHVMRLCHGHDESLTIPGADKSEEEQRSVPQTVPFITLCNTNTEVFKCSYLFVFRIVNYEAGKGASRARSLWRLEPLRIR